MYSAGKQKALVVLGLMKTANDPDFWPLVSQIVGGSIGSGVAGGIAADPKNVSTSNIAASALTAIPGGIAGLTGMEKALQSAYQRAPGSKILHKVYNPLRLAGGLGGSALGGYLGVKGLNALRGSGEE